MRGPQLKMPSFGSGGLRPPGFLVDLYWDLRDRHLLPLVGLALVAIVAVPFLLGGDSGSESEAPAAGGAAAIGATAGAAELTVVEAKPGLRDYHRRLGKRKATDPFAQRYTAPVLDGTELGSGDEGGSGGSNTSTSVTKTSTSVTETTKTTAGDTTTTTTTTTEADGGKQGGIVVYAFAADLKIVRIETKSDGHKAKKTSRRHRVLPPAPLPGKKSKSQVVTYLGIGPKSQQPLFLISDAVGAVYGEGKCISGSTSCQLLEVEAGLPVTFVHDGTGVRYKITVLDVEAVPTGKADPSVE